MAAALAFTAEQPAAAQTVSATGMQTTLDPSSIAPTPQTAQPTAAAQPDRDTNFPAAQPSSPHAPFPNNTTGPTAATPSSTLSRTAADSQAAPIATSSSVEHQLVKHGPSSTVAEATTVQRNTTVNQQTNQPQLRHSHTTSDSLHSDSLHQQQQQQTITPAAQGTQPQLLLTTAPLVPPLPPPTHQPANPTPSPLPLLPPPPHPLVALLHDSALSFDQLYATLATHDTSHQHYINLVLPLAQREMADKLSRIEVVSFELGMAQSNAMRMGRELDVMGAGMGRVREKWSERVREAVDGVAGGSEKEGADVDGSVRREGGKRRRDEEETNGESGIVEETLQQSASDAG